MGNQLFFLVSYMPRLPGEYFPVCSRWNNVNVRGNSEVQAIHKNVVTMYKRAERLVPAGGISFSTKSVIIFDGRGIGTTIEFLLNIPPLLEVCRQQGEIVHNGVWIPKNFACGGPKTSNF